MSQKFKLLTSYAEGSSPVPTDWSLCILCQKDNKEPLTCPAKNKNPSLRGYETLAANLTSFHDLKALPNSINLSNLDDGSGLKATLTNKAAKYHKMCRLN